MLRAGGATLIELLAVIIIMTMLAAAALPIIAPAMQNRQVREASRIVNGFFSGARNRAMQTGRPVGVVLERMQGLPEACITLSYAEVPVPYAGDVLASTVAFGHGGIQGLNPQYDTSVDPPVLVQSNDIGWVGTVKPGDLIKFNYVGYSYRITGAWNIAPDPNDPSKWLPILPDPAGYFTSAASPGPNCIWTIVPIDSNASVPSGGHPTYQITRSPIRSAAGSVQLPGTAVIDMTCSGFDIACGRYDPATVPPIGSGSNPMFTSPWVTSFSFQPLWRWSGVASPPLTSNPFPIDGNDTSTVTITFAPSGAVDRVWCWDNRTYAPLENPTPAPFRPTSTIHLMVGRRELVPLPISLPAITDPMATGFQPFLNWQDLGNYWVSINPQSGLVTTNEVVQPAVATFTTIPAATNVPLQYGVYAELWNSRRLAREAHGMGGR
jgi:type II secretory pathway pseudopilin PulG